MKRYAHYLYILTVLLVALTAQSVQAQNEQNALYIYRHDGQFNAFFFGDIDHFEYSCIDTLGVEHDDYVVQEIYALDSVYRIPLSAIDSVSFITPETKYKPDVVRPDASITSYIVASDSLYWIRLDANTPTSLIPKVGDKLLIEEESPLIPDGFGGLVTSVEQNGNGYTVMTKALALTDIYEQLVIKVAGASEGMENASTVAARRRGPLDGYDISITPEEPINLPTISNSINLKRTTAFLDDNSPLQINGDLQGSISASVKAKAKVRAFLTITPFTGFQYYQETDFDIEEETTTTLSGGFSARLELPFTPGIKFKLGKLKFDLSFGVFFEGSATAMSLTKKNTRSEQLFLNMTMDHKDIHVLPPVVYPSCFYRWHNDILKDTTEWNLDTTGQLSFGTGLYAKAEAKFKVPVEKLPDFLSSWISPDSLGFKVGFGADLGVKLDYNGPIVWNFTPATNDKELLQTPPKYTELKKSEFGVTGYAKLWGALTFMKWSLEDDPQLDFYKSDRFSLVPEFYNLRWHDEEFEPYRFTITSGLKNNILLPVGIGFAVFDREDRQVDSWWDFDYFGFDNGNKSYYHVFETLDPAKNEGNTYTIYPQVKYKGAVLLGDQLAQIPIGIAKIDIGQHDFATNEERNHATTTFVPNMKNVTLTPSAPWLTFIRWDDKGTLEIYWEGLPEKVSDRRGVIYVSGKTTNGTELVKDSIVVVQARTSLELSPSKLHFDKKGGTKTVTITKTNLSEITVSSPSAYVQCAIDGNVITVGIEPNNGPALTTYVYIEGKLPTGAKGSGFIDITQDGTNGEDPVIGDNIPVKSLSFWVNVGKKQTYSNFPESAKWINGGPDDNFMGISIDEEKLANQKYTLSVTENGKLLHVELQGRDTYETYDEDEYDVTGWDSKATLQFDLEKFKDGYFQKVRILNVRYTEDDVKLGSTETDGEAKAGEISFSAPSTSGEVYFNQESNWEDGNFQMKYTYHTIEVIRGDKLDVSDYKFSWDYKSDYWGKLEEYHYEWRYAKKDKELGYDQLNLKMEFADTAKFTEWIEKE